MNEMVERVARAICEAVGPEDSSQVKSSMGDWPAWHDWVPQAKAALASMKEPTPYMVRAGGLFPGDDTCLPIWKSMIKAALKE